MTATGYPRVVPINDGFQFHGHTGINHRQTYVSPEQFARDHTSVQLRQFTIDKTGQDLGPDQDKLTYAQLIWHAIKNPELYRRNNMSDKKDGGAAVADKKEKKSKEPKKPNTYTFTLKDPVVWAKSALQVKTILGELVANKGINKGGTIVVDEPTLDGLLKKMVTDGKLVTKQPPMRVFKYYIPKLRDELKVLVQS